MGKDLISREVRGRGSSNEALGLGSSFTLTVKSFPIVDVLGLSVPPREGVGLLRGIGGGRGGGRGGGVGGGRFEVLPFLECPLPLKLGAEACLLMRSGGGEEEEEVMREGGSG